MRDLNHVEKQNLIEVLTSKGLNHDYPISEFGVKCHTNPNATKVEYFCLKGSYPEISNTASLKEKLVILGDVEIRDEAIIGYSVILGDDVAVGKNATVSGLAYVLDDTYVKPGVVVPVGVNYTDEVVAA